MLARSRFVLGSVWDRAGIGPGERDEMELYAADAATEVERGLLDVTAHVDGVAIRCLSCRCEPRLLAHSRDSWQW